MVIEIPHPASAPFRTLLTEPVRPCTRYSTVRRPAPVMKKPWIPGLYPEDSGPVDSLPEDEVTLHLSRWVSRDLAWSGLTGVNGAREVC